jgi:hypothetical protein
MDLRDLVKLAGLVNPELLNKIEATAEVEEADGAGFEQATTAPDEQMMDDPMQAMGSDVDTSLRRYLKAKGDHVSVDEEVYPDHTVESVSEAYAAFKSESAEDRARYDADETPRGEKKKKVSLKKAPWEKDDDEDKVDEHSDIDRLRALSGTKAVAEDQGKVGHVEMFFTDRDGGEVSHEVEVTLKDGKLSITGNMPGPEDDLYYDDADIEEQLRDAMQDMSVIDFGMNEADIEENAFNQAAAAAARAGKNSFEFGGKTHKTTMKKDTAHKLDDDINILSKLAGISEFGQVRLPKPEPKTLPGICPPGDEACAVGPRPNPDHPDYVAPDRPPVQPKRPQSLNLSKSPAIGGGISSLKKLAGI